MKYMISVIVPVYNEEKIIKQFLSPFSYNCGLEVIVVDGQSSDKTVEFAKQYPVKVIQCVKNRAAQMNEGAKIAQKDILLFLHADCLVERGSLEDINDCLNNGYIGGCLSQRITSDKIIYRFIEASGNIRSNISKIFYGDQAIFVKKDKFLKLGGFNGVALFEDALFSKKLKKEGRLRVLNNKVFVSPRRWEKNGIMKTTFINWILTLGFMLGMPLDILKRIYADVR
ncbi:MAG: hypothetical protein A2047_02360 [Omnitrophica bacterium GWA2_41_15]|nr:MAG: hypothetical protein A2047_02360 [Omnitrophica bacterium GWA2_41_15]